MFQKAFLNELHATHMGVEGMKKLAHGKMTWKNMKKDIERKYGECEACLIHSRSKPNIPNSCCEVVPSSLEHVLGKSWQQTLGNMDATNSS